MAIKERVNEGNASRHDGALEGKKMLMDTVLGAKENPKRNDQGKLGIRLVFSIN